MGRTSTSGAWINGIVDLMTAKGIDSKSVLEQAGIDAELLKDPHTRFDTDKLSRIWEILTEISGDPAIALAASEVPRPATLDLLTYTMMTAPNMYAALQRLVRYVHVISDATVMTIQEDSQGYWWYTAIEGGNNPVARQRIEFILITILNILRWIGGSNFSPLTIQFASPRPIDIEPYAKSFSCQLQFDAPAYGVMFSSAISQASLPGSNPRLAEFHERFAIEFIESLDNKNLRLKIRDFIVRSLPNGDPPRSEAAKLMCMSERTLQRRLQAEGTTFYELVDETRRELSRKYLVNGTLALGQIAFMLGFADQSVFTRACQRWHSITPLQYRQKFSGKSNLS